MPYLSEKAAPTRQAVNELAGLTLLEFGTEWCSHCITARAAVEAALRAVPGFRHIKVEDGTGRQLGRSFGVKLWPTFVALRDGVEVARLARPVESEAVTEMLKATVTHED